jgi:hypothetical protein
MNNQNQNPAKPSDYSQFVAVVYQASNTQMDFESYRDYYSEILPMLFYNPDIDTRIALSQAGLVA